MTSKPMAMISLYESIPIEEELGLFFVSRQGYGQNDPVDEDPQSILAMLHGASVAGKVAWMVAARALNC